MPEGAGCYCAANNLLTMYLGNLIDNYPYMVMDNEAGLELTMFSLSYKKSPMDKILN